VRVIQNEFIMLRGKKRIYTETSNIASVSKHYSLRPRLAPPEVPTSEIEINSGAPINPSKYYTSANAHVRGNPIATIKKELEDRLSTIEFKQFYDSLPKENTRVQNNKEIKLEVIRLVAEEKRKEAEDPDIIDEDTYLYNQRYSGCGDSYTQIFSQTLGKGLVLHKSKQSVLDLLTVGVVETLRAMVLEREKKMFASHIGVKTIHSETRKHIVMTMGKVLGDELDSFDDNVDTSIDNQQQETRQNVNNEDVVEGDGEESDGDDENRVPPIDVEFQSQTIPGHFIFNEDRMKAALRFIFAMLDEIKSLNCFKPVKDLIRDEDLIVSIISNFGTDTRPDYRQSRHRDFSDAG